MSRFGAHVPVPGWPCTSACSAARSAPDATFFASSWAAMEERLPRLLPRWGQPPEQELLLQVLPFPRLLWTTGSANFFVAKREKRGGAQTMSPPGKRETIAVRPHYQALVQRLWRTDPRQSGSANNARSVAPDRVVSHLFTGSLAGIGKLPALAGWYIRYGFSLLVRSKVTIVSLPLMYLEVS